MFGTPDYVFLFFLFVLGTVIGSFLNVVIYRLHTGKSLRGRSHCLSCGTMLRWYELVPIISYIVLWGRCRSCTARVSLRYLNVELLTGVLFLAVGVYIADTIHLILSLVLVSLLIVITVYDIRHTIIPDVLVGALLAVAILYVLWNPVAGSVMPPAWSAIVGGVLAASVYGLLFFVSSGRWMGLGDAKLAFPLGMILGTPLAWSMIVFSFWIGAIVSVGLVLLGRISLRGKTHLPFRMPSFTIKSEIPFAPFLVGAFLLVFLYNVDVFAVTSYLLSGLGV